MAEPVTGTEPCVGGRRRVGRRHGGRRDGALQNLNYRNGSTRSNARAFLLVVVKEMNKIRGVFRTNQRNKCP